MDLFSMVGLYVADFAYAGFCGFVCFKLTGYLCALLGLQEIAIYPATIVLIVVFIYSFSVFIQLT